MNIEDRIKIELEKIRPYLVNDGGNIEFIKYEDGVVYVKMLGACSNCSMIDFTIKDGIESILVNEIPEVTEVVQIDY